MAYTSEGIGKLKPTGDTYPVTDVLVSVSHEVLDNAVGNQKMQQKKTVIHSITALNGDSVPPGEFDLLIGNQLIRLKKMADSQEWVVLSTYTA